MGEGRSNGDGMDRGGQKKWGGGEGRGKETEREREGEGERRGREGKRDNDQKVERCVLLVIITQQFLHRASAWPPW